MAGRGVGVDIFGPRLGQLPVKVDYPAAPAALVKVVHILGHDGDIEELLHAGQKHMGLVGVRPGELRPALVVEIEHEGAVAVPSLYRGDLLHGVVLPQAVVVAICLDAALGAYPGPGKDH